MPSNALDIREPKQIRALASMVRQDIVGVLESEGPLSVRQLGEQLQMPADALYYHIRLLLKAGLLMKSESDEGHLVVDVAGRPARLIYDPDDRRNRVAVTEVVRTIMRTAARRFARAFRPGASVSGARRSLWAGHARGRLTQAELEQVNQHIAAILEIVNGAQRSARAGAAGTAHEFAYVLHPVTSRRS